MITYFNDEIMYCGLKYIGHFNSVRFYIGGNNWGIEIPFNRIGDFVDIFPDVNWEDGQFLEILKGKYIRVGVNKIDRICSLKHITKELEYLVNEN